MVKYHIQLSQAKTPNWGFLKRYHMQHHSKTPDQRFGVSSPLWDLAFGTQPDRHLR